jgi:uncharacterized membrane protein
MTSNNPLQSTLPSAADGRPATAPRSVNLARALTIAATLALIALGLGWELGWAPTGRGTLALKVLPLLLVLPGMARHRLYTFRWLTLLVWLYLLEGLVRATSDRGLSAALAAAEVALVLVIFACATFYIRRRLAGAPASAAEAAAAVST